MFLWFVPRHLLGDGEYDKQTIYFDFNIFFSGFTLVVIYVTIGFMVIVLVYQKCKLKQWKNLSVMIVQDNKKALKKKNFIAFVNNHTTRASKLCDHIYLPNRIYLSRLTFPVEKFFLGGGTKDNRPLFLSFFL